MLHKLTLLTLVLFGCLALTGLAFAQTCADIHGTTGCVPSPYEGQIVTLTGVAYAVNGVYNDGSVYFNCGGGGAGGMTFYEVGATVAEGDEITVQGTVGAFIDEIQLYDVTYVVNSPGNPYSFQTILTGDLSAGTPNLGGFMQVSGLLTKETDFRYYVDDGTGPVLVYVDSTTGIDIAALDQWQGDVVSIAGATKCYEGVGEIMPRRNSDIQLMEVADEARSWGAIKSIYR